MKFATKFQKLLALPDNKTKILKLYNFAFTLIPNSEEQKQVKTEIEQLYNLGIKVNWKCRVTPERAVMQPKAVTSPLKVAQKNNFKLYGGNYYDEFWKDYAGYWK